MSIKLMSAIFGTEFHDMVDADGNTTKASTAKFVVLALADHTNDDGEGAYPSLETIARKTSLSRRCVITALDALKHNGLVHLEGISRRGTNNYTVNIKAFPKMTQGSELDSLVNPVHPPSEPSSPALVNPVHPIHPLTIHKPLKQQQEEPAAIFKLYEREIGILTPLIADALQDAEKTFPAAWISDAFREAVQNNKRNWKYIEAILKRWKEQGNQERKETARRPTQPAKDNINERVIANVFRR